LALRRTQRRSAGPRQSARGRDATGKNRDPSNPKNHYEVSVRAAFPARSDMHGSSRAPDEFPLRSTRKCHAESASQRDRSDSIQRRRPPQAQATTGERYTWNASGQLIKAIDAGGSVTELAYYPATGSRGINRVRAAISDPNVAGGYLARITQHASVARGRSGRRGQPVAVEYGYDDYGNLSAIRDGKGNATRYDYDAQNRLTRITTRSSRSPSPSTVRWWSTMCSC
jgi:YD repeat-containing protein